MAGMRVAGIVADIVAVGVVAGRIDGRIAAAAGGRMLGLGVCSAPTGEVGIADAAGIVPAAAGSCLHGCRLDHGSAGRIPPGSVGRHSFLHLPRLCFLHALVRLCRHLWNCYLAGILRIRRTLSGVVAAAG